jgi:DNA-binding transcriptional LysR family regulator
MMHTMHPGALAAMDLNLLVALHALLIEGNVTAAARRLSLSQSATSHALARLRERLGDPLLVRSGRRLDRTPRATALLPALERGLAELESALSGEPPFDPRTARRTFTLGTADYGQAVLLGPLLARLRQEAPGIDLFALAFPDVVERLDAGTMDLAVVPTAPTPAGYSSTPLFEDGFICMLRAGHPAARGGRLSMARYLALGHLLVAPQGGPGSIVDTELAGRGHQRRVTVRVSSFLTAPILVASSDLVSTGPERLWRALAPHYPVRLLPPPLRLPRFGIHLLWHRRRDNDPALLWMRRLLEEVARGPVAPRRSRRGTPAV